MFNLDHPKLITLAETEGYRDIVDFLEDCALDSLVPAICMVPGCDYTAELEPDQRAGFCELCGRPSMQSSLIIAGLI